MFTKFLESEFSTENLVSGFNHKLHIHNLSWSFLLSILLSLLWHACALTKVNMIDFLIQNQILTAHQNCLYRLSFQMFISVLYYRPIPGFLEHNQKVWNVARRQRAAGNSTRNTQHSTLNTQHSTLNTQHATLSTDYSPLIRLRKRITWWGSFWQKMRRPK